MTTPLGSAVQFLKDFGLFDVVLPFLLVFSIIFAILEKTKILGTEKVDSEELPRRTLNTMVSFVVGMLTIAANEAVNTINQALPNIVLLVIMIISFLMLVGVFYKQGDFNFKETHKGWIIGFSIAILILIILIFLNSIYITDGTMSWLDVIIDEIIGPELGSPIGAAIVFLIVVIIGIIFVTKGKGGEEH